MKKKLAIIGAIGLVIMISSIATSFATLQYEETHISQGGAQKVLIVVDSDIYQPILPSLNQYIQDLEAEDYNVTVAKYINGTPQELKVYIKLFADLKGVIFIGDLPVPWFEISMDFNMYGYTKFPIDLFYMDLDGEWLDTNRNGIYDTHNAGLGDLGPEIWLGRLTASTLRHPNMDEVGLLQNYFAKNHTYRTGGLLARQRALYYPDDDWYDMPGYLDKAYSDVTVINAKTATTGSDYKKRLKEDYEWIHVCVHSNPILHAFRPWGFVYSTEVRDIDPATLFYNLFACSNCKYSESDYMGGHYVFAKTKSLAAVGSTKTGSMLYFDKFYPHLGFDERKNMGESFMLWFNTPNLADFTERCWFYGMTLLGDPTLTLDPPIASIDSINPSPAGLGQTVTFNGSGKINQGQITNYSWRSSINGYLNSNKTFSTNSLSEGEHSIYFKVQDNKNRWSTEVKGTLIVEAGPSRPVSPSNLTAMVVSLSQIDLTWQDNSNNEDGFKIERSLDGSTFSEIATVGSNITAYNDTGLNPDTTYYYRVCAYNNSGNSGYSNTVSARTSLQNRPPVLDSIGNKTVNEESLLEFTISASDPDGDSLTYSASNLPQGASFTPSTRTFSWKPAKGQAGDYSVTFTVSDGKLSDSETISIKVVALASLPNIKSISPTSGKVGSYITITGANFGAQSSSSRVEFFGPGGKADAKIVFWFRLGSTIMCAVPQFPVGTYSVTVITQAGKSNSVNFVIR